MHGRAVIAAAPHSAPAAIAPRPSGAGIGRRRPASATTPAPPSAAAAVRRRRPRLAASSAAAAAPVPPAKASSSSDDDFDDFDDDGDDQEADHQARQEQQKEDDADRARQCRVRLSLAASTGRLDLSSLGLRGPPPPELWELGSGLADLSLAGNALSTLEGLGELSGLRRLAVAGNRLAALPAAAALRRLDELEGLWAHGNLLRALPEGLFDDAGAAAAALVAEEEDGDQKEEEKKEEGKKAAPSAAAAFPRLKSLSLAGNRLAALPPLAPGALPALAELALGGNCLHALPEGLARGAPALESLAAHGNALEGPVRGGEGGGGGASGASGGDVGFKVRRLSLQGNRLSGAALSGDWASLAALEHINVADNGPALTQLIDHDNDDDDDSEQASIAPLPPNLRSLTAYGNGLRSLPLRALASCRELSYLWLEGNPLSTETVKGMLELAPTMPSLRALGLDERQLRGVPGALVEGAGAALRVGAVVGGDGDGGEEGDGNDNSSSSWGPGYFKLVRGPAPPPGQPSVLVVAYGSAPGEPNWGGALKRARAEAAKAAADAAAAGASGGNNGDGDDDGEAAAAAAVAAAAAASAFDVLYVVDPHRDWYWLPDEWSGGGAGGEESSGGSGSGDNPSSSSPGSSYYASRVRRAAAPYDRVLLLGDSMGASACLMAAPCATSVLAFCPQVDLRLSAIRPGRPARELARWKRALLASVASAPPGTRVRVLTGTWQHDVDQAAMLADALEGRRKEDAAATSPQPPAVGPSLALEAFPVDSHRLAAALAKAGRLTPLLRAAIAREQGLAGPEVPPEPRGGKARGGVRLANLL